MFDFYDWLNQWLAVPLIGIAVGIVLAPLGPYIARFIAIRLAGSGYKLMLRFVEKIIDYEIEQANASDLVKIVIILRKGIYSTFFLTSSCIIYLGLMQLKSDNNHENISFLIIILAYIYVSLYCVKTFIEFVLVSRRFIGHQKAAPDLSYFKSVVANIPDYRSTERERMASKVSTLETALRASGKTD